MSRSKIFLSAILGLLILGGVAQAQDGGDGKGTTKERDKKGSAKKTDADVLLKKLSKKYSGFKDFACQIKKVQKIAGMAINSTVELKWKTGGKLRSDSVQMIPMMGKMTMQVVADGKKAHMYRSAPTKVYTELENDSPVMLQADLILLSLLKGDTSLITAQGFEITAQELSEDGVALEQLVMKNPMGITMKYVFKKADSAILRSSQVIKMKGMGGNKNDPQARLLAMGVSISSKYNNVKINKGIEDSVFVFKAPAGAKKGAAGGMGGLGGGLPGMGGRRKKAKPQSKPVKPKKDDEEDF